MDSLIQYGLSGLLLIAGIVLSYMFGRKASRAQTRKTEVDTLASAVETTKNIISVWEHLDERRQSDTKYMMDRLTELCTAITACVVQRTPCEEMLLEIQAIVKEFEARTGMVK